MKLADVGDTDSSHLGFRDAAVAITRDPDENTLLDVDAAGSACARTIEPVSTRAGRWPAVACAVLLVVAACAGPPHTASDVAAARSAFACFVALEGDWLVAEDSAAGPEAAGPGGAKGSRAVAATYRSTGAGSAVVETLWPGTPEEMLTVYHLDGDELVLTHYCSAGNQPRMRAVEIAGNLVDFEFTGGSNLDPARDMHMHGATFEFVSENEFRVQWRGWAEGRAAPEHVAEFRFLRASG